MSTPCLHSILTFLDAFIFAAECRGVSSVLFIAFKSAPFLQKNLTKSFDFMFYAAKCNGVSKSLFLEFWSAPCCAKNETDFYFLFNVARCNSD